MAAANTALIVGVGPGLGAALARRFAQAGMQVAVCARDAAKLAPLAAEIEGRAYACDSTDAAAVETLFAEVTGDIGPLSVVVYNASGRTRAPITELSPEAFERAWRVSCFGGFLVGRCAAQAMLANDDRNGDDETRGTILFTGATASVKAYAGSASFAVGKYGLRALAESMSRELAPQGVHVCHIVVDGGIHSAARAEMIGDRPADSLLQPDAIAETYYQLHRQHRSAWSWEIELRPWVEKY